MRVSVIGIHITWKKKSTYDFLEPLAVQLMRSHTVLQEEFYIIASIVCHWRLTKLLRSVKSVQDALEKKVMNALCLIESESLAVSSGMSLKKLDQFSRRT